MTFAPPTPQAVVFRLTDRAQGPEGIALRQSLERAVATQDLEDRGQNILQRVSAALHRASDEHGVQTSPEAMGRVLDLLAALPLSVPLPDVVVESESELGLDWDEGSRRVISLTVRDNPMVGYSAFIGAEPLYGRVPFFGEVPETIRFLLGRLYAQRLGR